MKNFFDLKAKDLFKRLAGRLDDLYGAREAENLVFLILEEKLKIGRTQILANQEVTLKATVTDELNEMVERLRKAEPVQYILGKTEFYGLTLKTTPAALIPRPETEELVKLILDENPHGALKTLDIGCGGGCIALAIKSRLKAGEVFGLDKSADALRLANENALLNKLHVNFFRADIFIDPINWHYFDIWVSNPPYVREGEKDLMSENVLKYEPAEALFVPDDDPLIFYRKIMSLGLSHLKPGGKLYFEINESLGDEIIRLFQQFGYRDAALFKDINGKQRMARAARP